MTTSRTDRTAKAQGASCARSASYGRNAAARRVRRRQRLAAWYERPTVHPDAYRLPAGRPDGADATTAAMDAADAYRLASEAATAADREARWPTGSEPEHAAAAVELADTARAKADEARAALVEACLAAGLTPADASSLAAERRQALAPDVSSAPADGATPAPRRRDRLQARYRRATSRGAGFTGPRTRVTGATGGSCKSAPRTKPAGSVGAGDRASVTPAGRAPAQVQRLKAATRDKIIARVWGGRIGSAKLQAKRVKMTRKVDAERARAALHTLASQLPSWGTAPAGGLPESVPGCSPKVVVFARRTKAARNAASPSLRLRA